MFRKFALAALVSMAPASAFAAATLLTNGTTDGDVSFYVLNNGTFGSLVTGQPATYNPVGSVGATPTIYESTLYLGLAGGSTVSLGSIAGAFTATSATSATSTFSSSGLRFTATQTLTGLLTNGVQTGTLLTQSYTIANQTSAAINFNLVRYTDADLNFVGDPSGVTSILDGGGRMINTAGQAILFTTDTATNSPVTPGFVGIYSTGGTAAGYQVAAYRGLEISIGAGNALTNTIQGDGPDADQYIDAGTGYDVTMAVANSFSLARAASTTYTTYTIFGNGPVTALPSVPEPATWALLLLGFGGVGTAMRRGQRGRSGLAA